MPGNGVYRRDAIKGCWMPFGEQEILRETKSTWKVSKLSKIQHHSLWDAQSYWRHWRAWAKRSGHFRQECVWLKLTFSDLLNADRWMPIVGFASNSQPLKWAKGVRTDRVVEQPNRPSSWEPFTSVWQTHTALQSPIRAIINDCLWGIFLDGIHFQDRTISTESVRLFCSTKPGLPSPGLLFSIFNSCQKFHKLRRVTAFAVVSNSLDTRTHIRHPTSCLSSAHTDTLPVPVGSVEQREVMVYAGGICILAEGRIAVSQAEYATASAVLSRHLLRHTSLAQPSNAPHLTTASLAVHT